MTVIAKFTVSAVVPSTDGKFHAVYMYPVYHQGNPDHPNYKYWEATPSGQIMMNISNTEAVGYLANRPYHALTR